MQLSFGCMPLVSLSRQGKTLIISCQQLWLNSTLNYVNLGFIQSMSDKPTVTDIFKRALEIRATDPNGSYEDVKSRLKSEFGGKGFPETAYLTIPEYDNVVPEEDWTSGLPVVLRGIQNEDWDDVVHGIIISLEQVENYPKQSGREDDPTKEWRNRGKSIGEAVDKNLDKWMPDELMDLAKRSASK